MPVTGGPYDSASHDRIAKVSKEHGGLKPYDGREVYTKQSSAFGTLGFLARLPCYDKDPRRLLRWECVCMIKG